jgi:hypothetical protein
VRALLTLLIVAVVLVQVARGREVEPLWTETLMIALDGKRAVGFNVWDQPDVSPAEQKKNLEEARKLPDGPKKDALRQQAVANERVFVGRTRDQYARITLSDANVRPRIRLWVGPDGEAKLEFLDASGKVTQTLPDSRSSTAK